ncbi:MAG: hypothetical protein EHM27_03100, partial [Deltaproteobacteria bacterium]
MPRNLANGRRPATGWAGVFLFLRLMGCATQRGPVLYPNEHLKAAEEDQARQDIAECNRLAENYVKSQPGSEAAKGGLPEGPWRERSWATRGAVTGHFGRGAAIGGVAGGPSGLIHGPTQK